MIHTVQTSNRWVENDLALSPTAYTKCPTVAKTPTRPLTSAVGVLIPATTTIWLLGMTSPVLAFPPDATGFEAVTFTNRAIHYGVVDESLLDAEDDPALLAFLDYLDQQMAVYPELIVEADYAQLERIAKLVEGVELEDDD